MEGGPQTFSPKLVELRMSRADAGLRAHTSLTQWGDLQAGPGATEKNMKCSRWILGLATTVSMASASVTAQQWSGIIDATRAIDWSSGGVRGGIPNRSTVCATLNPGASTSQINSAIASCPSGQVVFLNAGTYSGLGGIDFNGKNGVTLRGAGANQTFLVFAGPAASCRGQFADLCIDSVDTNWSGGPSNTANWTAGYSKGTTSITLDNFSNLKAGNPLILDQADDAAPTADVTVCANISTPCALEGNSLARSSRNQVQIVQVVSCGTTTTSGQPCNGGNVTIAPGLYMPQWTSAKSPGAWWATSPASGDGIENLSMDHTSSSGNRGVTIFNCTDCWVSGVRSIDSGRSHVEIWYSNHVTVRDSYFYLTQNSVSQSYGVSDYVDSDVLIQNNIFHYVATPVQVNNCEGCVAGYNFAVNNYYTGAVGFNMIGLSQHSAGTDMDLFEGNFANGGIADVFHGTHNFTTYFRNVLPGNQPACYNGTPNTFSACSGNQVALFLYSYSRFYNIVGNVLGQSGVSNGYQSGSKPIYLFGGGDTEAAVTVPLDSMVQSSVMRWGNYDTVTGAVRWCGNSSDAGWTTTCGSTSEVPTGLSKYANAVPATTTLPASFYLSSQPSWWPSSKPWPPIGPDVSGGSVPNVGGHVYTIPAADCYLNTMGGLADGTGPLLTFNANTCYSNSSAALPAQPTGLQAVVN